MPSLTLIALLLAPAAAPPDHCATAGVPEMAAATAGETTWAPAVAALRAARETGCDDPWLALNLARAERNLALATGDTKPTCGAARSHHVVLQRGEPRDAQELTGTHAAVLDALCAARQMRDGARADPGLACIALHNYDVAAAANAVAKLALDLTDERAPLEAHCAASKPPTAASRPAEPFVWIPATWAFGGQLAGSLTFPLDAAPPGFDVGPHIGAAVDVLGEARHLEPIRLRALVGYGTGALGFTQTPDEYSARRGSWRWHTLTAGVGARWMITDRLDFSTDVLGAVLLDAVQVVGEREVDATALFEPVQAVARVGIGYSPGPVPVVRFGLSATVDLTPRADLGDAGMTTTTVLLSFGYLHPIGRELPPMQRVRKR